VVASGPLYDSGIFWAEIAVAVAVASIVFSYGLWKRGSPRRQLGYSLLVTTPLLRDWPGLSGTQLSVLLNGEPLKNPHVSVLHVRNRSRSDIPSSAFDGGKPIVFGFASEIVLAADAGTTIDHGDALTMENDQVILGPVLIGPEAFLSLTVLTKGPPKLTCRGHLIGVDIREDAGTPPVYTDPGSYLEKAIAGVGMLGLGLLIGLGAGQRFFPLPATQRQVIAGVLVGISVIMLTVAARDAGRRRRVRQRARN